MRIAYNYSILLSLQKSVHFSSRLIKSSLWRAVVARTFIEFKTKQVGSEYIASWGKSTAGAILL